MRVASSSKTRSRGFTLVELMVVMILIGIMSAVILPEMRGTYEDALLRSTARKLVDVFQLAHSRAITRNQEHRFRFDEKSGHYTLECSGAEGEPRYVAVRDFSGSEGDLDTRITVKLKLLEQEPSPADETEARDPAEDEGGRPPITDTIVFRPDGSADSGEILLRDRQGFRLALRINPATSRVEIVEGERE